MVLGQLARGPMHGYRIAKIIGDVIGPFRRVQWGALYPVLARLEQQGFIESVCGDDDGRSRKVYAITPTGRQRLHELLLDTSSHLGEYDTMFAHKVTYFSELQREERVRLAQHYAVHAQQTVDHMERERADLLANHAEYLGKDRLDNIVAVLDHRIAYWRREREWAEFLIQRERATQEV